MIKLMVMTQILKHIYLVEVIYIKRKIISIKVNLIINKNKINKFISY